MVLCIQNSIRLTFRIVNAFHKIDGVCRVEKSKRTVFEFDDVGVVR